MKNKIIIVGAGINGLVSAYHLLKRGDVDIEVYDRSQIPNPESASFGKHRLIHPWNKNGCVQTAQKALTALSLWRDILNDIGSDGFEQTGVFALSDSNVDYRSVQDMDTKLLSTKDITGLMPLLEGTSCTYAYHFPQFGVLFADKILTNLVQYLRKNGVHFCEGSSVVLIDSQKGEAHCSDGKIVVGDRIIISAGYRTDSIIQSSFKGGENSLPNFRPKRCYVVYVKHPRVKSSETTPSWASLGVGDMWGMPSLRGIPMKLGCGDFTRSCDPIVANDANAIAQKVVDRYIQLFPQFNGLEIKEAGMNHWAEIDNDSDYMEIDRAVIVTSDNGAGFKFAPQVALNVVNSLFKI